tara:strand:+ start:875 stop:1036 length:162 start_codon:yes stop_codon:yes gene_type:complete
MHSTKGTDTMTKGQKARQRQRHHRETLEAIQVGLLVVIAAVTFCSLTYFTYYH